jgi:serine/threonine protein phosphatase PrpC
LKLAFSSAMDIGRQRDNNEDSILIVTAGEIADDALPEFGIFCLADGAGGHGHGDLASSIAVKESASELIKRGLLGLLEFHEYSESERFERIVREAFELADNAVLARAGGGVSTLTVGLLQGDKVTIGHAGDCRAYFLDGGGMELITKDHSIPWRLMEIGQLEREEILDHPQRNLLWNALGKGANLHVDIYRRSVPAEGHLLLCSDGLWGEVGEEDILQTVRRNPSPASACRELVQMANESGGADNISIILIAFSQ